MVNNNIIISKNITLFSRFTIFFFFSLFELYLSISLLILSKFLFAISNSLKLLFPSSLSIKVFNSFILFCISVKSSLLSTASPNACG